jgi:hypothetical protein
MWYWSIRNLNRRNDCN